MNRKMKKPWKALQITKRTWKAIEALASPNPETVSAPKNHVRPKRDMTPAIPMSTLMVVFMSIFFLVRSSFFRICLMMTIITKTKMTMLKSRMAKMGPRKAPKNTAGSETKQLEEENNKTHSLCICLPPVCSVTYNPRFSSVGMRTTRSLLTVSERSTAIGITTGMIGTTGGRARGK